MDTEEKVSYGFTEDSRCQIRSVPTMKIEKLATSMNHRKRGIGHYMIDLASGFAARILEDGIACRFMTVDAYAV